MAINGLVLRHLVDNRDEPGCEQLLRKVVDKCSIFASMSPDDKALLIELL